VIIVIGSPLGRLQDQSIVASGTPARAALAAAAAGRSVELVGRTGDDPSADALLLSLAHGGVGHAALLRDPARATPMELVSAGDDADPASTDEPEPALGEPRERPTLDAADVELGLRYLTEFAVLVLAEPAGPDVVRVVADAASWNAARLLLVVEADTVAADGLPADAIVFEAPADDSDGVFATLVGRFAAALDEGADPADAFRSSIEAQGWIESAPEEAAAD
jgi:sugar/nucleoside kinase (ribokinase family)